MSYKIVNKRTPKSMYKYKAPYAMNPIEICIHNTQNTASARNEVAYMNGNRNYTSYHVAIDDKEAVQAIPFNRNAFAAGDGTNGRGNRRAIHIEICYSLDGGNNGYTSARYRKAEANAVTYTAHVLHQYGWGVDKLKKHQDYSGKWCPAVILHNKEWGKFKSRVQTELNRIKSGKKTSAPKKTTTPKKAFNKKATRGRSTTAHFNGTIDNLGAEVRKRRGSRKAGFNWNQKAGYSLKPGAKVYIFEVHNGWGRIYTGRRTGKGSNEWVYLDRVRV